jgi:hypothetical protein
MWTRRPVIRECSECGREFEVDRRDADRKHHYCSPGCIANGWRDVHGLPRVPEWTGSPVSPPPAQLMQWDPTVPSS